MIYNVHFLRVIAALLVVYFHIASRAGLHLPLSLTFGICGVDVFFVISGFIIAYIGCKKPEAFFVRRLIRIVPFYWSATLCVFMIAWFFPSQLRQTRADVTHLIYSLFFIPHQASYGSTFPTLILGWSLNYEMYFYALFAIALLISTRFAPVVCCGLLAAVSGSIGLSGTENWTLAFYGASIVIEFAMGVAVYYVQEWICSGTLRLRDVRWLKSTLVASMGIALAFLVAQEVWEGFGLPRPIAGGLPSFVIVLGAILLERVCRVCSKSRIITLLGEASYILYLVHPYVVYGILRLAVGPVSGFSPLKLALLTVVLLSAPTAAAVAIHLWFERPLMDFLRRLVIPDPAVPKPALSEDILPESSPLAQQALIQNT